MRLQSSSQAAMLNKSSAIFRKPAALFASRLFKNKPAMSSTTTPLATTQTSTLETLQFANTFSKELPADPSTDNTTRQVFNSFFSYVDPTPTSGSGPTTIIFSESVCNLIGLDPEEALRPEFALIFSGNATFPAEKTRSYAQCYGGHQFGSWAGQLGDGRAICLGEVLNPATNQRWELQLKGAGKTPYSRFADGRAVLRSSLREFVGSEAMAALGIPTTRALSLVATGDEVLRDMFYNGNAQMEPGAVVCRVARSFIRFGSFQLPASRGDDQMPLVKELADFVIRHFYQEECSDDGNGKNKYAQFLAAVARRTGYLIAEWQRVGKVHGVMNTDNMSILGDTIDYGPYGWMERYNPNFTPNTTDLPGRRYCFAAQPEVGQWNVLQLARTFLAAGLMTEDEAREGIVAYGGSFTNRYTEMMAQKMGLKSYDKELINGFLKELYEDSTDYTNTFRALSSIEIPESAVSGEEGSFVIPSEFAQAIGLGELSEERVQAWNEWVKQYRSALFDAKWESEAARQKVQYSANPAIIPRNHVLVGIIGEAEAGNYEPLEQYVAALMDPYNGEGKDPAWLEPGPKQTRMGVELLSCSS